MAVLPPAEASKHIHDQYWRLHILNDPQEISRDALVKELRAGGYTINGNSKKRDLVNIAVPLQTGKVDFEKCSTEGLRRMVISRYSRMLAHQMNWDEMSREVCIKWLQRAERLQKFSRFMDLPPELRERVMKYYVREFQQPLTFPTQPPLARTCKFLRGETLRVVYDRATFVITYCNRDDWKLTPLKPSSETIEWMQSLHSDGIDYFPRIRKLCLKVMLNYWSTKNAVSESIVVLDNSSSDYQFHNGDRHSISGQEEELCRKVCQKIASREGNHKVRREDVYAFRNALERRS